MTFNTVGGNFQNKKLENIKIHQQDQKPTIAENTRMDNPKITKTTIN